MSLAKRGDRDPERELDLELEARAEEERAHAEFEAWLNRTAGCLKDALDRDPADDAFDPDDPDDERLLDGYVERRT